MLIGANSRVAVEPELAHEPDVVERGLALVARDGVAHRLGEVEIAAELVVVTDLDRAADLDPARRGLQPARDEIQESALARAVGADDADAIARFEHVVERLQDEQRSGVVAVAGIRPREADAMQLDSLRAQSGAPQRQTELAFTRDRCGTAREERVGGVDARLGFRGARGRAASQPRELAARQVLAGLLGRGGLRLTFDAVGEVCRVAGPAGPFGGNVEVARAAVDLEHFVGDAVEYVPVVGDEEQATRERGEPFLEVGDRVEVEVVGRLVEDEGVPLAREQGGERHALLLSARQLVGRRVEHTAHAEAREHRFALPLVPTEPVAHRGTHGAGRQDRELG